MCIWLILSGWPIWQTLTVKTEKLLNFCLLWGYAQLRDTPKIDTLDLTAISQISRALMTEIFKSDLIEVGAVAKSNTNATTL